MMATVQLMYLMWSTRLLRLRRFSAVKASLGSWVFRNPWVGSSGVAAQTRPLHCHAEPRPHWEHAEEGEKCSGDAETDVCHRSSGDGALKRQGVYPHG